MRDAAVAKSIAFKTDMQDQTGGILWSPTVRGFMHSDFYLVMRTFPDRSPNVRPGRAFSHVLILKKSDIDFIEDIGVLINLLPNTINKDVKLEPLHLDLNVNAALEPDNIDFLGRFNKVVHGYFNDDKFNNTIVWVGEDGFELCLIKLWKILHKGDRSRLNFGINFNVDSIPIDHVNLINVPESIENKFFNKGFCVVRKNEEFVLAGLSEQVLAGEAIAKQRIENFKKAVGLKHISKEDLSRISIIIKTFENINTVKDIKKVNTLSHVVAEYSPNSANSLQIKSVILERICLLLLDASVQELPVIRNFKIDSFEGSREKILMSLDVWLSNNLFSISQSQKNNYSILFQYLESKYSKNWWAIWIKGKVIEFLNKNDGKVALVLLNWINFEPSLLNELKDFIPKEREVESNLLENISSNLSASSLNVLRLFALEFSFYKLYAKILSFQMSNEEVVEELLKLDVGQESNQALDVVVAGMKPLQLVLLALKIGDKRLILLAGSICISHPSFLATIDFSNQYWQEIWLVSLQKGLSIKESFRQPKKKVYELFDAVVSGVFVIEELLVFIGNSDFGNLLDYSNRSKLLNVLPSGIVEKYLSRTSSALLNTLSVNSSFSVPNDIKLAKYIEYHALDVFLYHNSQKIKVVLPIFWTFQNIREKVISDYIFFYSGHLSIIDAKQIGRLVYERGYSTAAEIISNKSNKRSNWRFALQECQSLISFINRSLHAFSGTLKNIEVSKNDWWDSAEDIVVELYSSIQSVITLWRKSGGNEADLFTTGTTSDAWSFLFKKLKTGPYKNVSMGDLLEAIRKDYGTNQKFRLVYELRKKFI
ncbi:hypothetical protein EFB08_17630 [Rufibacter latericius]|uniref:Uncharacterized protein n=2 Tax=Rufibacter latericius TaxID=2487040 RepID=A0A3M9MCT5_9BACT|nr:hypothetical protein EFB08_17630 [Rufibacter latericius]